MYIFLIFVHNTGVPIKICRNGEEGVVLRERRYNGDRSLTTVYWS